MTLHAFALRRLHRMMERRFLKATEGCHLDNEFDGDWTAYPDQRIGTLADPYLDRWFVLPKNEWPFGWIKRTLSAGAPIWMHMFAASLNDKFSINVYLHLFHRSDDDRALHDHPWWFNASWVLDGEYDEIKFWRNKAPHIMPDKRYAVRAITPGTSRPGWITSFVTPLAHPKRRREGGFYFRCGASPHRVQLITRALKGSWKRRITAGERPVWTLFIMGPYRQTWGFYCKRGWIHWKVFTAPGVDGRSAGCGETDRADVRQNLGT